MLARDKLTAAAESARLEGWGWVEVAPRATASELHAFQWARHTRREPSKAEAKRIAKLEVEQDKLDDEDADLSDDGVQPLHEELDRLGNELEAIEQTLIVYAQGVVPMAGAVVSVDHMGGIAGCCGRNRPRRCGRRSGRRLGKVPAAPPAAQKRGMRNRSRPVSRRSWRSA